MALHEESLCSLGERRNWKNCAVSFLPREKEPSSYMANGGWANQHSYGKRQKGSILIILDEYQYLKESLKSMEVDSYMQTVVDRLSDLFRVRRLSVCPFSFGLCKNAGRKHTVAFDKPEQPAAHLYWKHHAQRSTESVRRKDTWMYRQREKTLQRDTPTACFFRHRSFGQAD